MRFVALLFPRLAIQLARRANPELAGRPLGLIAGEGDGALLAAVSVEATADGVEAGMTCLQARQRCPGIVIEPDDATRSLAALEAVVSILKSRTTTNVAIVSRNEIVLSLEGTEHQFADEGAAALALVGLARSWSGLDVRAAVASSIEEATCAVRTARRFPVICPPASEADAPSLPVYEPVSVAFRWQAPVSAAEVEARIARMVPALESVAEAYGQSYREVLVELEQGPYRRALALRPLAPIHTAAEALALVRDRLQAEAIEGATAVRVTLSQPGPSVRLEPWRAPVARFHQLAGPAVPIQRRLLRAS